MSRHDAASTRWMKSRSALASSNAAGPNVSGYTFCFMRPPAARPIPTDAGAPPGAHGAGAPRMRGSCGTGGGSGNRLA